MGQRKALRWSVFVSPFSWSLSEIAAASGALPGPFNRDPFDGYPAPPPATERQELPLAPADRHDLALAAAYFCTAVKSLQPQRRLDLV